MGHFIFDPDEVVLFLVFLFPLAFVVAEAAPRLSEAFEDEWAAFEDYDEFALAPSRSPVGRVAACLRGGRRLVWRALGYDDLQTRNVELEKVLSVVIAERRWQAAKLQAQMALRQRDREQHSQALLTAVHTLRTVATNERGAHQTELAALEEAALSASAELERERDERVESERVRGVRTLQTRLSEAEARFALALDAATTAQRAVVASELESLEREAAGAWREGLQRTAEAEAELAAIQSAVLASEVNAAEAARATQSQLAELERSATLHGEQLQRSAEAAMHAQAALWATEKEALERQLAAAQQRASEVSAEAEGLRVELAEASLLRERHEAPEDETRRDIGKQRELEVEIAKAREAEAAMRLRMEAERAAEERGQREANDKLHAELEEARAELAEAEAEKLSLMENMSHMQAWIKRKQAEERDATATNGLPVAESTPAVDARWMAAASALSDSAPRAVGISVAELKLITGELTRGLMPRAFHSRPQAGVMSTTSLSAVQLWRASQAWRHHDVPLLFAAVSGRAAVQAGGTLATSLCDLQRSIEEEVCAWDYREFNYCYQEVARQVAIEDGTGAPLRVAGGMRASAILHRDHGHEGMRLADFVHAADARRARLCEAEVLALRLVTGRLGLVLQGALITGTRAAISPWATTIACVTSAIIKLVNSRPAAPPTAADAFVPLDESGGKLFEGTLADRAGVRCQGWLCASVDPWAAREALADVGGRALVLINSGGVHAADVGWVSQFPQQCELLLPPGTVLLPSGATNTSGSAIPPRELTGGVRCLEASVEPYAQPIPFTPPFLPDAPVASIAAGLSVPGGADAATWACQLLDISRESLHARKTLRLPLTLAALSVEDARKLGLLVGRAAAEICPQLDELCMRGASSALNASSLAEFVAGVAATGHSEATGGAGERELRLDLHGALRDSLAARPADAAAVGEAIGALLSLISH